MANRWTDEQQRAIDIEGNNVIVSAGAGSGKTAVLSERVLRKVNEGTHINELLILTFTKAAAQEMKDRIRKKLIQNNLMDEVELIDSAYITTFDSYSLSLVKKYHYILGVSNDIKISDSVLLDITKRNILESIMNEYYSSKDNDFKNLICKFSLKDDTDFVNVIMNLSNKIDLKYDREEFLDNYMQKYYSEEFINSLIDEYITKVYEQFNYFKELILEIESLLDEDKLKKMISSTCQILKCNNYEEIASNIKLFDLPRANGYDDDAKEINEKIKMTRDELKKMCIYDSTESIKNELMSTYTDTSVIVNILAELNRRMSLKKSQEGLYDFNDISHLAIKLVKEHHDICSEIKSSFKEILIDEYQDTSDTQETFISLISDHNVYMVGDIKQSIYRFRNANPYIFKNKYDVYSVDEKAGFKIDLNKNFRSREEVLSNINLLFCDVMDDEIGGADYKNGHQAIFGNTSYNEEGKTSQNYDLKIYTYSKNNEIPDVCQEAFIIARDIKKKMDTNYKIFDKDEKILRKVTYNDFVILMDKKKNFDLYKKIFEYLNVPLTVYREEKINNTADFLVIYNLLKLVMCVYHNNYDVDFRYSFMAVARSYLFNYDDDKLFSIFKQQDFINTDIVQIALAIKDEINYLTAKEIFRLILSKYNYYEKILTTVDVVKCEKCIEYLDQLIGDLEENGSTIDDVMYYLNKVLEKDYDIKYDNSNDSGDSVKIMSIHKSKGLEFSICYFADLQNRFNLRDQKEKVIFNNHYGIILPNMLEDESKDTIQKQLYKMFDTNEEVSERIRLFYVALTRCKEHMIMVCPEVLEYNNFDFSIVPSYVRKKYMSFYSILKSIWYKLTDYVEFIDDVGYSKEYLYSVQSSKIDLSNDDIIAVSEVEFSPSIITEKHFSKSEVKFRTAYENKLLEFGTKIHEVLEEVDFRNPRLDLFNISPFIRDKVEKFLDSDLIQNNINEKFYKEYEFMYESDLDVFHGIIDLLIEREDKVIIVDYKLKNIDDNAYVEQLNGYRRYIEHITNKVVEVYLYSILDSKYKLVCN